MPTSRSADTARDPTQLAPARVASLSRSPEYSFSKGCVDSVRLIAGVGVEGDVHAGRSVRHRSRVARDPTQPNRRQVHLIERELIETLAAEGYDVAPGRLGENVLTEGLDGFALPTGSTLEMGEALLEVTGLRNPCGQLNGVGPGLMDRLRPRADDGTVRLRAGIMAIVLRGGRVSRGDEIRVTLPPEPHRPLAQV